MTECVCKICGNKFQGRGKNSCYCSKECKKEGVKQQTKEYHQRTFAKPKAEKKRKQKPVLDRDIKRAKKAGKTYGQYIAESYKVTVDIPKTGYKSRNQRRKEFFEIVEKFEKGEAGND